MNISTYESRIKALEDQLNPPEPSGSATIESISISPDINGINAILANAQFNYEDGQTIDGAPEWARGFNITHKTTETLPDSVEVTIVPHNDLYVVYADQGAYAYGEKGKPVTYTAYMTSGEPDLRIMPGVINTNDISTADYGVFANILIIKTEK